MRADCIEIHHRIASLSLSLSLFLSGLRSTVESSPTAVCKPHTPSPCTPSSGPLLINQGDGWLWGFHAHGDQPASSTRTSGVLRNPTTLYGQLISFWCWICFWLWFQRWGLGQGGGPVVLSLWCLATWHLLPSQDARWVLPVVWNVGGTCRPMRLRSGLCAASRFSVPLRKVDLKLQYVPFQLAHNLSQFLSIVFSMMLSIKSHPVTNIYKSLQEHPSLEI